MDTPGTTDRAVSPRNGRSGFGLARLVTENRADRAQGLRAASFRPAVLDY